MCVNHKRYGSERNTRRLIHTIRKYVDSILHWCPNFLCSHKAPAAISLKKENMYTSHGLVAV